MDFNWNINSCKRLNEYGTITFEILSTTFCSVLEKDNTRGHTAFLEAEIVLIFLDCHIYRNFEIQKWHYLQKRKGNWNFRRHYTGWSSYLFVNYSL